MGDESECESEGTSSESERESEGSETECDQLDNPPMDEPPTTDQQSGQPPSDNQPSVQARTGNESAKLSTQPPAVNPPFARPPAVNPPSARTSAVNQTSVQPPVNPPSARPRAVNQPSVQPPAIIQIPNIANQSSAATTTILNPMEPVDQLIHSVFGDLEQYSNEWDWGVEEQAPTQQKLDQIVLKQHAIIGLLERMQEGQKQIALRLEQLERASHFAASPVQVGRHPPKPKSTPGSNRHPLSTPGSDRNPLQPVSLNQPMRLDSENHDADKTEEAEMIEHDPILVDDKNFPEGFEIALSILTDAYKDSKHRANFASRLVRQIFPETVLKVSNVRGKRGKKMLNVVKMAAVRDAVFRYYPLQPEETPRVAWDDALLLWTLTTTRSSTSRSTCMVSYVYM